MNYNDSSNNLNSQDQISAIQMLIEQKVDLEVNTNNNWRPIHFITSDMIRSKQCSCSLNKMLI